MCHLQAASAPQRPPRHTDIISRRQPCVISNPTTLRTPKPPQSAIPPLPVRLERDAGCRACHPPRAEILTALTFLSVTVHSRP